MLRIHVPLVVLLSCTAAFAAESPSSAPERPKSAAAATALGDYDKATRTADDTWKQARINAERRLIDKLKIARNVATRANDLTEANAIDTQIRAASGRIESLSAPTPSEGVALVIRRGMWAPIGREASAVDVTDQVRKSVRDNVIEKVAFSVRDPAFGLRKELVLDCTFGAFAFTVHLPEGSFEGFRFIARGIAK